MSHGVPRRDEWRLHPDIVRLIWQRFGTAQMDLFASRENTHCRWWFSLNPRDLPPLGVDALAHTPWPWALLYPLQLILPLLERVRQRLSLIIVAQDRMHFHRPDVSGRLLVWLLRG